MVHFHLNGDTKYVIPELAERCVAGIDSLDADDVDRYPNRARVRESISADTLIDSELGEVWYGGADQVPLGALEGERREEERKRIKQDVEAEGDGLIFLQVPVLMTDGSKEILSMLVNDFPLGYVEVEDYWHGSHTKGLIDGDN